MQINLSKLLFFPLIIWLASCGAKTQPADKVEPEFIPVRTIPVSTYHEKDSITVSGQFTTDDEAVLAFKMGGVINKIWVKEGDAVKKGQLLATLNMTEINAGLQQTQLAYEKAMRDFQRTTNLYADSVATLEQLQNAKTALQLATAQLNAARFNQSYSEIRASSNGYVLRKIAAEGQVVN